MRYRYWVGVGAGIILGLIFVAAGLGKLLYQTEAFEILLYPLLRFLTSLLGPALVEAIIIWLPYIELTVGLLLIIGIAAKLMAAFSLVLIASFIASNSWLLSVGLGYEPCPCWGIVQEITQTKLLVTNSLYFDIGMLGLALLILFYYQSNFFNIYPWFLVRRKIANDFRNNVDG